MVSHTDRSVSIGQAPSRTLRLAKKLQTLGRHRLVAAEQGDQAHGHKTGQRRGFQKSAVLGLDLPQLLQHARRDQPAKPAGAASPRRIATIQQQADRDQCRQRITYHVQPQRFVPTMRQDRQLERQAGDVVPGDQAGQCAIHQDGDGEGAILAIFPLKGRHDCMRTEPPARRARCRCALSRQSARAIARGRSCRQAPERRSPAAWWPNCWGCRSCRPSRHRRFDVGQPGDAGSDPRRVASRVIGQAQSALTAVAVDSGDDESRPSQKPSGCIRCKSRSRTAAEGTVQAPRIAGSVAESRTARATCSSPGPPVDTRQAASSTGESGRSPSVAAPHGAHGRTPAAAWLSR